MEEIHVTLTPSQRDLLLRMLNEGMRQKLVEVRRASYSFEFRHQLEAEEREIEELISMLGQSAPAI